MKLIIHQTPSTQRPCPVKHRAEGPSLLTDEAVALVAAGIGVPCQHAALDFAKGLEDTLDVVVRKVRVHRRHVDTVIGTRLLCQLVNDGLRLADVTWPPHLQHTYQHRGQLSGGMLCRSRCESRGVCLCVGVLESVSMSATIGCFQLSGLPQGLNSTCNFIFYKIPNILFYL